MKFFAVVISLIIISFILQEFVPVFDWAYGSRLLIVHAVFYTIAVAVPFPAMLGLAMVTGFIWDARYHLPVYPPEAMQGIFTQAELPFGFTILIFGLMGSIIQGVRPLFRRGRWELPVFMIGLCTTLGLLLEYLVISFHRGGLEIPAELWWKLLMTALFSSLISPFLLLLLSRLADRFRYRIRMKGLKRRYTYDGDAL
ncbi:MAG: hypothetical protein P1U86_07520 [Verrucomicrobiales bacterium]|nr:hypothetical protein [Verrucomicrobiales bacterium]